MHRLKTMILTLLALVAFSTTASANPNEREIHDQLVVILDASGSMAENLTSNVRKMDAAKDALIQVMKDVPKDTNVGVACFGDCNSWVYELGPKDEQRLNKAIGRIRASGATPLGTFIKLGADRLLQEMRKQNGYGSYKLLIVTDGDAAGKEDVLMRRYTPDVVSRGITVDVIGVGMKRDHSLKRYARTYYDAQNPEQIVTAARKVVAEVDAVDSQGRNTYDIIDSAFGSDDATRTAIKAFASSGYYPIGEKPPVAGTREGSGSPAGPNGGPATTSQSGGCQVAAGTAGPTPATLMLFAIVLLLMMGYRLDSPLRRPVPVKVRRRPEGRTR